MKKPFNTHPYDEIDEAAKETFPNSDPPAWTLGTDEELLTASTEETHDLTHILAHEHYVIKKVMSIVMKLVALIEDDEKINMTMFKKLIGLCERFIEQGHQQKEEILYPALQKGGEGPSDYMVKDLLHEHADGDKLMHELVEAIDLYEHDKKESKAELVALLKQIRNLEHNHVNKEDEYIIPAINKNIDKEEQKKILAQFDKIDKDIGVNTRDEILYLADKLSDKYLH